MLSLNSCFNDIERVCKDGRCRCLSAFLCSLNVILTLFVFAQGSLPPLQAYLTGRISTSGDVRQVVQKVFFDF